MSGRTSIASHVSGPPRSRASSWRRCSTRQAPRPDGGKRRNWGFPVYPDNERGSASGRSGSLADGREHRRGLSLKSHPCAREGRAPRGHGGRHGRRPSAAPAGTPGNGGPASTHPAPRRADPRVPGFQFARLPPPAPGRARRGRRRGEELKIWNPGNLGSRERAAGPQVSRFPARRLALAPGDRRCGVAPRWCGDRARLETLSKQPGGSSHRVGR